MNRELMLPFSLRIGEETLRKGYEDQDKKFIYKKIYINGICNLIFNIVFIIIIATQQNDQKNQKIISTIAIGCLLIVNILIILSFYYFRSHLKRIQTIYEILSVQVILYVTKMNINQNENGNNILNGFIIGACIFNIIIGQNFMNKLIMNMYALFMITIYQFASQDFNARSVSFIIFTILFFSLSIAKGYQDEKQRRILYIYGQQKVYLGDQIISHTPVGILATKFCDDQLKFEVISINAKAQQLLHMDESQQSLDNFLKTFEIDNENNILQRSDLSMKQSQNNNKEQNNQKKKSESEMSLFAQCRFQMMKMIPAYPRELKQRMKKRESSTGKNIPSGITDKETDITQKNHNININTHSVIAEVKQYNGYYNNLFLSLSFSTYTMVGDDKYAIFCINTDPYKKDYHNLKNKNYKYQTFFANFWAGFEKSLISQIRDWKTLYSDFLQFFTSPQNSITPQNFQRETVQNFCQGNITPSNLQTSFQSQNQPQQCIRESQSKKSSFKYQSDQKGVISLLKINQQDGGFNQLGQMAQNIKQLNTQFDDCQDQNGKLQSGSYINLSFSPKKEKQLNGGIFHFQQQQQQLSPVENSHEKGSMNFDYFTQTQESMNNIQQFQQTGNNSNNNINENFNFNQIFSPTLILNQNTINNNINSFQGSQISSRNQKQIQRVHQNCHKIMYDFQNWYTIHEIEFGQNILINQRQAAEQLDLDRLLTKILSIFEIIRSEKQIKVIKQIKLSNTQVNQSSKKIHIVLYNIIQNAFQYCKYQSIIQINISDCQNCVNIQILNDILQEEEINVQNYIQNQVLVETKNVLSSITFDNLNQFSLNFNSSLEQNENQNNNNNAGSLARKKGDFLGLKVARFLLRQIGPQDRLKIDVKNQKFNISFDIFLDVNNQRKKQTSIFQRYKKNSTLQNNGIQTDPNQSNFLQIYEERQAFETMHNSYSEQNNSINIKTLKQPRKQTLFDRNIEYNYDFTLNIQSINDEHQKIGMELEEKSISKNKENYKSCDEYDQDNESMCAQSDISEQYESNMQKMSLPSQLTPSFIIQTKVKSLQYQSMQSKFNQQKKQ